MKKLRRIIKELTITVFVLVVSAGIFTGIAVLTSSSKTVHIPNVVQQVTKTYKQEPALLAQAQELGIDVSKFNLVYFEFSDPAQFGEIAGNTIKVRPGPDEKQSLAHEYYHYVWTANPDVQALSGELASMYQADEGMQSRMQWYLKRMTPESQGFKDELFAIYCSESSDGYLTANVLAACNKYMNRAALTLER